MYKYKKYSLVRVYLYTLLLLISACSGNQKKGENLSKQVMRLGLFPNEQGLNIEKINKGSTNEVFIISHKLSPQKYVLISPKKTLSKLIDLNYEEMLHNTHFAGEIGVGPNVVALDIKRKFVVEEFIEGSVFEESNLSEKVFIQYLAKELFILHSSSPEKYKKGTNNIKSLFAFEQLLKKKKSKTLNILEPYIYKAHKLLKMLTFSNEIFQDKYAFNFMVPCHNDIHSDNIIVNKSGKIKIIDWDFSGIGDPFYDLVFGLNRFDFSDELTHYAIDAYLKNWIKHYKIPQNLEKGFTQALHSYALCMFPLVNYWCALYTAIKLENSSEGTSYHKSLKKRLVHYLDRFERMYMASIPYLNTDKEYSLERLNRHLNLVVKNIKKKDVEIYIGGSGAISFLENIFYEVPIVLRDLDLVLIEKDFKKSSFSSLFKDYLKSQKLKYNRPKIRVKNNSNQPQVVGHQYIIENPLHNSFDFDFSIFPSLQAALRNGIFDVDKVLVKVPKDKDLFQLKKEIKKLGFQVALKKGLIVDSFNAFESWKNNTPYVVNWGSIDRSPISGAFRVARTHCKLSKTVDPKITLKIQNKLSNYEECDANILNFYRGLFRVLGDQNGLYYFKFLDNAGVFDWAEKCLPKNIKLSKVFALTTARYLNNFFAQRYENRERLMVENYSRFLSAPKENKQAEQLHREIVNKVERIFQYEYSDHKRFILHQLKNIALVGHI